MIPMRTRSIFEAGRQHEGHLNPMSVLYLFCGKRILLDNCCALHKYYALVKKNKSVVIGLVMLVFSGFHSKNILNTRYDFLMANRFLACFPLGSRTCFKVRGKDLLSQEPGTPRKRQCETCMLASVKGIT